MSFAPRPGLPTATLLAALLGLASPDAALAQQNLEGRTVRRIRITGLRRLSEAELLAKMKLRIGQPFEARLVSEETGRLYLRGAFSRVDDPIVREFEDGVEVIFPVEEKPRIRRVIFNPLDVSSGNTSIGERTLRDAVSAQAGGRLSIYALQLDANQIERAYKDKGYLFATCSVGPIEPDDSAGVAGVDVKFLIKEGPRVHIDEIVFEGNENVSDATLKGQMLTKEKDFFFGFIDPGYYEPIDLVADIERVKTYYQSLGFFDVVAASRDFEFHDADQRLKITIAIEEGPRYTFTGYRFQGNQIFAIRTLENLVHEKPGGFFSAERMGLDINEILKFYKDRAYIDVAVKWDPIYGETGTTLDVLLTIEENHEIYIDRITILGNIKTRDDVIRRELEFFPGEKFNGSRLEKSRSNLARLQIFQEVKYELVDTAPNRKEVHVKVTEQPTGRLLLGFGVTSGFGIIGNFAVTKRNFDLTDVPDSLYDIPDSFTGAGQTLNIRLQPGTRRSFYQFSFTEPYLFESRNSLTLDFAQITILRNDFDEKRLSFRPQLGHAFDFDRDLIFSMGSRMEQVDISEIEAFAAPDVFAAEGSTDIIAMNSALLHDKVLHEPLEGPYKGHRERISYEYGGGPLGGDLDFSKVQASLELFFPLFVHEEENLHHVISVSSRLGLIDGHHDTDEIPIFERFFLGGPNTVRGFDFRGLGPQFFGDALGGTAAWYGNVEYVFPIFQKFLRGVLFFDYGNLESDISTFDLDRMRFAAGVGIRVNFPFLGTPLPVGLYIGEAFQHEDDDDTKVFLFTIGAPF